MGRDKASLLFEGRPLAERAAAALGEACDEVLVASGDGRRLAWLGLEQVADAAPDAGPLAGIVGGLERAGNDLLAVVAVDMPFASSSLLRLLAQSWRGEDVVAPVSDRGPEPLHAVYSKSALPELRARLSEGTHTMRVVLAGLRRREVDAEAWSRADPSGRFCTNLNTPEDLASASLLWEEPPG
jgi:molybdopterin-guanine dinucleotide biosynthesis protein A